MSLYHIMYSLHDGACKLVLQCIILSQMCVCSFVTVFTICCVAHVHMYSVFMLIWSILRSIPYYFSLVSVCVEMYTCIQFVYNLYGCVYCINWSIVFFAVHCLTVQFFNVIFLWVGIPGIWGNEPLWVLHWQFRDSWGTLTNSAAAHHGWKHTGD